MLSAPRLLVVDPLDGTRELLSGTGDVAVLVGLLGSGEPQAGAVALPAEDLVLAGARGLGAFVQRGDGARKPMRVATGAALDASCRLVVSRAHPPPFLPQLIARAGLSAPHARGAVGLKLALVALGRADLYVHADRPIKIWDLCAPHAVVMAAGGVVTDLDGGALDYTSSLTVTSGLVSGTAAAHAACLKAIREIQRGGTSIEAASNR
jgi:3'(2'), 5'-bisphosphate nucleotidase